MNHPSNKITPEHVVDVVYAHELTNLQQVRCTNISQACEAFMRAILINAPDCADRSTALRDARQAKMWAVSAIALAQSRLRDPRLEAADLRKAADALWEASKQAGLSDSERSRLKAEADRLHTQASDLECGIGQPPKD